MPNQENPPWPAATPAGSGRWRVMAVLGSCAVAQAAALGSFEEDVAFLKRYTNPIVLSDAAGRAKVVVVPALQGRVMTSTATGDAGDSYGWINRALFASRTLQPHINVFGGEDRFWMGPEGGQFSIFFARGVPFELKHWFTPAPLDTEPFETVSQSTTRVDFRSSFTLTNYSDTRFEVSVSRAVQLLSTEEAWAKLGLKPGEGVDVVAFESVNRIHNAGRKTWTKASGLLSMWILGMFTPSPETTVVIPIKAGPETELGKRVTSDYFGPVPPERLVIKENAVYFSGDGQYRSKIGINPLRAQPVMGSYDAAHGVLTLVQFTLPEGETNYVNSLWQIQAEPYAGDVANSYNDGPPEPGAKSLGPFYELESSSPAAALAPGESLQHIHRTLHLRGSELELNRVTRETLGVSLQDILTALPKRRSPSP